MVPAKYGSRQGSVPRGTIQGSTWNYTDEIHQPLGPMCQHDEVTCVVVRSIVLSTVPHDIEKALRHSAFEPVKAHVHGFGCFWNQKLVDETMCGGVVGGEGRLGLFVAHSSSVMRRGTAALQL